MRSERLITMAALAIVVVLAAVWQFAKPNKQLAEPAVSASQHERTVFGEPRANPTAVSNDEGTRTRTTLPKPAARLTTDGNISGDLQVFLDHWRNTLISGDASAQAELYARKVDRFFTKRNVSRDEVRREKERLLTKYPEFLRYDISNVRLESMDANRAVITFRKDWDTRGRGRFAGSEQQRLTLTRESGSWKIVGEEEIKVYWVRRT